MSKKPILIGLPPLGICSGVGKVLINHEISKNDLIEIATTDYPVRFDHGIIPPKIVEDWSCKGFIPMDISMNDIQFGDFMNYQRQEIYSALGIPMKDLIVKEFKKKVVEKWVRIKLKDKRFARPIFMYVKYGESPLIKALRATYLTAQPDEHTSPASSK